MLLFFLFPEARISISWLSSLISFTLFFILFEIRITNFLFGIILLIKRFKVKVQINELCEILRSVFVLKKPCN